MSTTLKTTHDAEAKALLLEQLKDKPNFLAMLGLFVVQVQSIEEVLDQVLTLRWIDSAFGNQLDVLGSIVGVTRQGRADDPYRIRIKTKIRVNFSSGIAQDFFDVFAVLLGAGVGLTIDEYFPAALVATFFSAAGFSSDDLDEIAGILSEIHAAGVDCQGVSSEVAADATFQFSDTDDVDETSTTEGFSGDLTALVFQTMYEQAATSDDLVRIIGDGAGTLVATSLDGRVVTSHDGGESWATQQIAAGVSFTALIHAGGLYVAAGSAGALWTSPDGDTWTSRTSGFGSSAIVDLAYGGGNFVAVGASGKISNSPNGTSWTSRTSGFGTDAVNAVAYGGTTFVAVGANGKLSISTDGGSTWTSETSQFSTTAIQDVTYGAGTFVAVGSSGKISISTNGGTSWTLETSGFGTDTIDVVSYVSGSFGAFFLAGGFNGKISKSSAGTSWSLVESGNLSFVLDFAASGDLLLAAGTFGTTTLLKSSDGATWTTLSTTMFGPTSQLNDVLFDTGYFFAAGQSKPNELLVAVMHETDETDDVGGEFADVI